jgi:hypothetical protein
MSDRQTRQKQFLKKAALAVGGICLFYMLYFGSWLYRSWGLIAGTPRPFRIFVPEQVYFPLHCYMQTDLPGGDTLWTLKWWCLHGGTISWQECSETDRSRMH